MTAESKELMKHVSIVERYQSGERNKISRSLDVTMEHEGHQQQVEKNGALQRHYQEQDVPPKLLK